MPGFWWIALPQSPSLCSACQLVRCYQLGPGTPSLCPKYDLCSRHFCDIVSSLLLHLHFLTAAAAVEVFTEFWRLRICSAQFSVWLVLVHGKMSRFPKLDPGSPRLTVQWEYCISLSHLEYYGITQWHLLGQQIQHSFILLFKQHKCIPQFSTNQQLANIESLCCEVSSVILVKVSCYIQFLVWGDQLFQTRNCCYLQSTLIKPEMHFSFMS